MRASPVLGSLGALGIAFAIAGCSDPGATNEPLGTSEAALSANEKTAFDYFLGKGLTNFQAAGIIGNLMQESNVDPKAVQPGGPGRGIAQWSVGGRWDSDANDNTVAYASKHSASVYALSLQLDFIWYELSSFSSYGLASLKKTTNVTDATVVFQTDFEGCGTCLQSQRITYAKEALTAYGGDVVDAGAKDAGEPEHDAGDPIVPHEGDASPGAPPNAAEPTHADLGSDAGGCSVATPSPSRSPFAFFLAAAALVVAARRRRR
ncbi:MAG TPA: phage tail tip lysozyme [Labilithrix sp.]